MIMTFRKVTGHLCPVAVVNLGFIWLFCTISNSLFTKLA